MIITEIQRRKKSLVALYLDGEFFEDFDKKTVEESDIHVNMNITQEEIQQLRSLSKYNRGFSKALYLLSRKDYFSGELVQKLKEEAPQETVEKIVSRLEELRYINDEAYARRYASYLLKTKLFSISKIRYTLAQKKVDRYLIEDIISELEPDNEEQIREIIERKYLKKVTNEKGIRQTVAALQRMGYNWQDIKKVINEFSVLIDSEDE